MSETINQIAKYQQTKLTVGEFIFGALLAIAAISSLWISTALILRLFSN